MNNTGAIVGLLLLLVLGLYLVFEVAQMILVILGAALAITSAILIIRVFSKRDNHTNHVNHGARL